MLLARSVGSMGMALPAFLAPGWRTGQQAREQAPTTSLSLADACNDNGRRPCMLAHRTEEPDLTDWYGRRAKPSRSQKAYPVGSDNWSG